MKKSIMLLVVLMLSSLIGYCKATTLTQNQKERAIQLGSKLITDYYRNVEIAVAYDSVDFDRKEKLLSLAGSKYFRLNDFESIEYTNDFGDCLKNGDKVRNYSQYKDYLVGDNVLVYISPKISPDISGHSNIGYDEKGDFYFFYIDVKVEVKTPNANSSSQFDKASHSDVYFFITFKPGAAENAEIKFERTILQSAPNARKLYAAIKEAPVSTPVAPEKKTEKKAGSFIVFDVFPADAHIKIDGIPIFYVNKDLFPTSQGRHKVSIEREGYLSIEKAIDCSKPGEVFVTEKLMEKTGRLSIRDAQNLAGAMILIDDVEIGRVPVNDYKLKVGDYKITVKKEGYLRQSDAISVKEDQTTVFSPKRLISTEDAIRAGMISANGVINVFDMVHNHNRIMGILGNPIPKLRPVINGEKTKNVIKGLFRK